jgi:DNA-binding GntR family transcriptional regulator
MAGYKSKTTLAVEMLREKILLGEVGPGERFDVRNVAAELNMSITPVREALRILQADGLVAYDEHRSISAMQLNPDDAVELYLLRERLESLAARLAAHRWQADDADVIRRAHEEMVAAAGSEGGSEHAAEANRSWHFAVYRAARARFVEPNITRLWAHVAWSATWSVPGRLATSVREHAAITEAVLSRDAEAADRLMRLHIAGGHHVALEHGEKQDPPQVVA